MTDESAAPAQEGSAPPAEVVAPTTEPVTSGAPPQEGTPSAESPAGARPNRAQERIEELNDQRRAAVEYGEFWRQRYEADIQRKAQEAPAAAAPAAPAADPEPKLEDFDDTAAFTKAYTAWARKEAVREAKDAALAATRESQSNAEKAANRAREAERLKTLDEGFTLRSQEFAEKHPDYYTAISNPALTFFNGEVLEAIKGNEKGPDIAFHIAKDPKLVARLASKSVPQRLAELGRIEAELSRPAPPPKVTTAPTPPTPVGGGSGGEPDPSKMSTADWMAWRTKQLQANRRGR